MRRADQGDHNMPKITVFLSSYNHARFIAQTIDSVLAQTYTDFELIIWDDASTDDSWAIITAYADARIRCFRSERNGQILEGMNRIITSAAAGEYIQYQRHSHLPAHHPAEFGDLVQYLIEAAAQEVDEVMVHHRPEPVGGRAQAHARDHRLADGHIHHAPVAVLIREAIELAKGTAVPADILTYDEHFWVTGHFYIHRVLYGLAGIHFCHNEFLLSESRALPTMQASLHIQVLKQHFVCRRGAPFAVQHSLGNLFVHGGPYPVQLGLIRHAVVQ
jgi:glycosyltransferase involved in cell wall biosynthesis